MSFLTPLYLLGLAAVGLPLVFHLIRRQPRGRRVFSTLMFLDPSPPRVTRRSRLEHWPLLLLRAAAVCLMALAFARPFLRQIAATDAGATGGETIAVLVDTSASMRRAELWDDAVRRIAAIVARTAALDRLALLAFDRDLRPVVTFDEWAAVDPAARPALVRERLAGVAPGWAATHLDQALLAGAELLAATGSSSSTQTQTGPKRLVVVSDLIEGSRVQALAGAEWPQDVSLTVEHVRPASPTNAGVQLVAATDDGRTADRASQVRVRVTNAADSATERFQLRWQPSLAGQGPAAGPIDVYCPPGQSRVVRVTLPDQIEPPARLLLEGDDHPFDNAVIFDAPPRETLNVLHYTREPADDPAGMRFYLERAFAAGRRRIVAVTAEPPDAPGPVPLPRDVPLVIVSTPPGDDRLPGLRRYVEQGGTLLLAAGDAEVCSVWNGVLGDETLACSEADVAGYAMLAGLDFGHPLFAAFGEPRYADFTGIRIWRHRQLAFAGPPVGCRVLARFDGGSPAILEQTLGRGRVLLFAFGWHPADSQWALSTKFVPMLHALVGLAAGTDDAPQRLVVGDPLPLSRELTDAAELTVHTPDRRSVRVAAGEASFRGTVVPGVYRVATDGRDAEGRGRERRFTVTLPPEESRTAPLPIEQLEALGVRLANTDSPEAAHARAARERQLRTKELESTQKHWRWLIVAALAALLLETGLAARLARHATGSAESSKS